MSASLPAGVCIVQHSLLESRGGAARVADLLCGGIAAQGARCRRTFELAESEAGAARLAERPGAQEAAEAAAAGSLVHLHASLDWAGLLAALGRAGAGGRAVLTLHDCRLFTGGCPYPLGCAGLDSGCPDPCPRGFPDSTARRAAQLSALAGLSPLLLAPSRWMRDLAAPFLESLGDGLAIRVLPNGVPFPASPPGPAERAEARRAFGIEHDARVVLFAAHGAEAAQYKGGHRWAELRAAVAQRLPGTLFVQAGGEEVAREDGLLRLPYLPPERLSRLMRAADLMLYPTLADNHPLIVLEAMAEGLPTLSFAVGGIVEQIVDGKSGFLVRPGDWRGMAERASRILAAPSDLRRARVGVFAHGRARFSLPRMVADHAALYAGLLAV